MSDHVSLVEKHFPGEEVLWFAIPKSWAKGADRPCSPETYLDWASITVRHEHYSDAVHCLLRAQIIQWQIDQELKVTVDTKPGTEVEITDPDYQPTPNYRVFFIAPDPRFDGAVVFDELRGYDLVEWEHLRLKEPPTPTETVCRGETAQSTTQKLRKNE